MAWPPRMDEGLIDRSPVSPCLTPVSSPCRGDPLLPVLQSEHEQPLPAGTAHSARPSPRPQSPSWASSLLTPSPSPDQEGGGDRCSFFTVVLRRGRCPRCASSRSRFLTRQRACPSPWEWLLWRCRAAGQAWGPRVCISHKLSGPHFEQQDARGLCIPRKPEG